MTQRGYAAQRFLARMANHKGAVPSAEIPQRVCVICIEVLPVSHTAVMLMAHPDNRHTLHASSPALTELEELQYTLGEGPSVEAFTSGYPVTVPDVSVPDMRWPMFSSLAHPQEIHAVFAFPLQLGGVTIGVLSLAREHAGGLTDDEQVEVFLTADAVTLAMLSYLHGHDAIDSHDAGVAAAHMWDQMKVDEAIGMVMAQLRSTATMALARLRATAFVQGKSLPEVASDVLNRTLRFHPEPPEPGREHRLW